MWTKGYLTGGLYPAASSDEWDALYRVEGARRRWKLYLRSLAEAYWHRYEFLGPPPVIVADTWLHCRPNPARAEWEAAEAARRRNRAAQTEESQRKRDARILERAERKAELDARMGPKWGPVGGRNRWIARERWLGRGYAEIAAEADVSAERVRQICVAQQRKTARWRAPKGRIAEPDPNMPRGVWLESVLGDWVA